MLHFIISLINLLALQLGGCAGRVQKSILSQGWGQPPLLVRPSIAWAWGKELVFPVAAHLQPRGSPWEKEKKKTVYRHYLNLEFSKMMSREGALEDEVDS